MNQLSADVGRHLPATGRNKWYSTITSQRPCWVRSVQQHGDGHGFDPSVGWIRLGWMKIVQNHFTDHSSGPDREIGRVCESVRLDNNFWTKYVGPPYHRAEMYAGRVACCPWWVTVSMPTGQTERRTDVRPLHYAFR